ncbi:MAG TPA: hypothetical protein VIO11_10860 [Candidatus Methanoperedens sp.]
MLEDILIGGVNIENLLTFIFILIVTLIAGNISYDLAGTCWTKSFPSAIQS